MAQYYPKSQIITNLYTNGDEYQIFSTKEAYTGKYFKISNGKIYSGLNPNDPTSRELTLITPDNNLESNLNDFYYPPIPPAADVPYEPSLDEINPVSEINPLQDSNFIYSTITNSKGKKQLIPQFHYAQPTLEDYKIGEFQRYFCKKTNETIYQEISVDYYTKLKTQDTSVVYTLYIPIKIPWTIVGTFPSVYNINKNIVKLVERKQKWEGFSKYFRGEFLKYHIEDSL